MRNKVDKVNHSDVPDLVLERIHALMHRVRGLQQTMLAEVAPGLTHLEGRVLSHFARHPGGTQRELVAQSKRDKGQVARLVATLKERGLLDGTPDEHDKRVERLSLSEAGRSLHDVATRHRRTLARRAVKGLDVAQQTQLLELLEVLHLNLDDATLED